MLNTRKKIERYLRGLPPGVLEVQSTESIEILEMTPGSRNINFHVRVNHKDLIFRVSIDQQSGPPNQIEYEFRVLKLLKDHRIAPKAYYLDESGECFDFGVLIEEYFEGPHLSLEKGEISKVAELLVRLHSLESGGMPLLIWRDPLADTYELVRSELISYEAKRTSEKKAISLAKKLLAGTEASVDEYRHLFDPDCLNHTDVVCDNFVKTSQGLRLIDWEKPRIDDCSYDICCFLSEPAQLWCSQKVLTREDREDFLKTYARLSGKKVDLLREKVRIREPLVSLHWILWGASRLWDLRECRTVPELVQAHEERRMRYERIAHPDNIEKLLESFDPKLTERDFRKTRQAKTSG